MTIMLSSIFFIFCNIWLQHNRRPHSHRHSFFFFCSTMCRMIARMIGDGCTLRAERHTRGAACWWCLCWLCWSFVVRSVPRGWNRPYMISSTRRLLARHTVQYSTVQYSTVQYRVVWPRRQQDKKTPPPQSCIKQTSKPYYCDTNSLTHPIIPPLNLRMYRYILM